MIIYQNKKQMMKGPQRLFKYREHQENPDPVKTPSFRAFEGNQFVYHQAYLGFILNKTNVHYVQNVITAMNYAKTL